MDFPARDVNVPNVLTITLLFTPPRSGVSPLPWLPEENDDQELARPVNWFVGKFICLIDCLHFLLLLSQFSIVTGNFVCSYLIGRLILQVQPCDSCEIFTIDLIVVFLTTNVLYYNYCRIRFVFPQPILSIKLCMWFV